MITISEHESDWVWVKLYLSSKLAFIKKNIKCKLYNQVLSFNLVYYVEFSDGQMWTIVTAQYLLKHK